MKTTKRSTNKEKKGQITTRDIAIAWFVYRMGWVTTEHVTKVFFVPDRTSEVKYYLKNAQSTRRFIALTKHKILAYEKQLIRMGEGRADYIRYCTKEFCEQQGKLFIPPPNVWSGDFRHDKLARDLLTDMMVGAQINYINLAEWKSERELKSEYTLYIPDAYVSLHLDEGNPWHFFLEADRNEEDKGKWRIKMERIAVFLSSDFYKETYVHYRVRFPVVTLSWRHAETMKKWTEEMGGGSKFWFTSFDKAKPETILTEPIWMVAGQDGFHSLNKTKR